MSAREDAAGAWSWFGCRVGAGARSGRSLLMGKTFAASQSSAIRWRSTARRAMAAGTASIHKQVVGLERLCRGRNPFGTRRGAPLAALVDRQFERVDEKFHLVAGGGVRGVGSLAERILVDLVERGEAAREKFAIHHPFGKSVDGAKAELPR